MGLLGVNTLINLIGTGAGCIRGSDDADKKAGEQGETENGDNKGCANKARPWGKRHNDSLALKCVNMRFEQYGEWRVVKMRTNVGCIRIVVEPSLAQHLRVKGGV